MRNLRPPSLIRNARERAGLTREQAAVRAGISSTTLYLAERAGLISAATAAKLAPILGVPADQLLAPERR
jgi:transcriptional regulator with XRE-family HTH domain